jgi:hypothetical protein
MFMSTMVSTEDLRGALRAASETGAAFVADAVPADVLSAVAAELAPAPFAPLPEHSGRARQQGEIFVLTGEFCGYPAVRLLRDRLTSALRAAGDGIGGLDRWHPNDVSLQRYLASGIGITPHLDLKRYHYLVAVVTVEGTAEFTLCRNREGEPIAAWQASPGSLVLLRGPGLGGVEDGRPLHMVAGPVAGRRTSLGIRMDTRPDAASAPS